MHSVGDILQKVEKTLRDSNMGPRPGPGPRCQLRAQGPMGPKGPKISRGPRPHGPKGPKIHVNNVTFWVAIKDWKTKLWENDATHLRIIKKVWGRVKNTFFCIILGGLGY